MTSNAEALLIALGEVNEEKKLLEAKEKELRAALGSYFEGLRGAPASAGKYVFNYALQPGRKTLDKKAVEEAGIDLSPYYKTGKPFSVLKITHAE